MALAADDESVDLRRIRAVVFDLGGVLIDIDFRRCIAAARHLGLQAVWVTHPEKITPVLFGAG